MCAARRFGAVGRGTVLRQGEVEEAKGRALEKSDRIPSACGGL